MAGMHQGRKTDKIPVLMELTICILEGDKWHYRKISRGEVWSAGRDIYYI